MSVLKGTVKWFNGKKGFGFIEREDKEKDAFVHASAVKAAGMRYLEEGQKLEFELEDGPKGPSAINLKKQD
jgi:cold shock protein